MPETAHTEQVGSHTINVYYDTDPQDPRKEYDHLATMVCFHGRYNLGDDHGYSDPLTFLNSIIQELMPDRDDYDTVGEAEQALQYLPIFALPLYLYDHSGIKMSVEPFSCPWDSGRVGMIYVTASKAKSECPPKEGEPHHKWHERIVGYLKNEVKEYDAYLTGQVFHYEVLDENGESIDSCSGFYSVEDAVNMAKENLSVEA